ncbi:MAG TPA: hypothetical protein VGN68_11840, partial [Sphingopyxis sp.]|uniref:hypothetical protein n=1 Tax=Sphingopyxis sp. TaxID=1908224 RepID=UPI002E0D5FD9|nr:hypothetical protein [Sphingopyxis sp.]
VEIAEIIALAAPPLAAAILVETHCLIVAFGSSIPHSIGALRRTGTHFTTGTDSPHAANDEIYSLNRCHLRTENSKARRGLSQTFSRGYPALAAAAKTSH